eukprot:TRINITY_DN41972_c0_g1_i1.p1 TRINITY_DN41972_c0_g1~~TRINITY_DN41972_c0_g1_i1.p1  ORF type:complete len:434 (-),score=41.35 TRINITY_DN41972_c0_g1_i1:194-1495(-)
MRRFSCVACVSFTSRKHRWVVPLGQCFIRTLGAGTNERVALLIDGDQVSLNYLEPLVAAVSETGTLSLKRFYTNQVHAVKWKSKLETLGIDPVVVPLLSGGNKSPVDMEIMGDAVDLAKDSSIRKLSAIAVASNDVDYIAVMRRISSLGLRAYLAFRGLPGVKVPSGVTRAVEDAGGHVLLYSLPCGTKTGKVRAVLERWVSRIEILDEPLANKDQDADATRNARQLLAEAGYLAVHEDHNAEAVTTISAAPIAKFFHMNNLGQLTVYPRWQALQELVAAIQMRPGKQWVRDPGNLVLIEPLGKCSSSAVRRLGGTTAARVASGGGPFLLEISEALVLDVLFKLGYSIDRCNLEASLSSFYDMNSAALRKQGMESANPTTLKKELHDVLCFANCISGMAYSSQRQLRSGLSSCTQVDIDFECSRKSRARRHGL